MAFIDRKHNQFINSENQISPSKSFSYPKVLNLYENDRDGTISDITAPSCKPCCTLQQDNLQAENMALIMKSLKSLEQRMDEDRKLYQTIAHKSNCQLLHQTLPHNNCVRDDDHDKRLSAPPALAHSQQHPPIRTEYAESTPQSNNCSLRRMSENLVGLAIIEQISPSPIGFENISKCVRELELERENRSQGASPVLSSVPTRLNENITNVIPKRQSLRNRTRIDYTGMCK
jgi:hypothetical protein